MTSARTPNRSAADRTALAVLKGGLAFVFLYAAVSMVIQPDAFAKYFPAFMDASSNSDLLLTGFALYEVVIAVGILSGRFTYAASLLAALTLVGIVVANIGAFEVLFRNVAIACAAVAVALLTKPATAARSARPSGRRGRTANANANAELRLPEHTSG